MYSVVRDIGINGLSIELNLNLSIRGFPRGQCTLTYRNFRKFNLESFRNDVVSQDWDDIHNLNNPSDQCG